MAEPFLWGSRIALPTGLVPHDVPHVTALANGTFLVLGKVGTHPSIKMKAWIYNADGSIKEERDLDVPAYGRWSQPDFMESVLTRLVAVELPDGRIGIMATADERGSGFYVAFAALFSADLTPLGPPKPLAGLNPDGTQSTGWYRSDAIVSLGNGDVAITYYRVPIDGTSSEDVFIRILKADGTLSDPTRLGSAETQIAGDSITDMTALPSGDIVIVTRENASTLKGYVLTPSGAGGPSASTSFEISTSTSPQKAAVKVTVLNDGGFVVTWMEQGSAGTPDYNAFFRIYKPDGTPLSDVKAIPSITLPELLLAGNSDVLALPNGGFAVAYEKATQLSGGAPVLEVHIALFDKNGTRVTEDLRVSGAATTSSIYLEELHLMADGRILVRHSQGIQIVDPRDEAVSLTGTIRDDQYIGTAFKDTMEGGGGRDSLVGAGGNDRLTGGDGDDRLFGDAGADTLQGGSGTDFVSFANAQSGVTASLAGGTRGDAAGDVYSGIEGLIGSSSGDVFTGNGSAILMGGRGNDVYYARSKDSVRETAGEGRDTVIARSSFALRPDAEVEALKLSGVSSRTAANLTGSNTDNAITGHAGVNTLKGQGGNDVLKASSGNDRLYGGTGNDTLHGGSGNDSLKGESGRDVFVFDTKPSKSSNVDRVYDFNPKYDSFWLENKYFTKLGKGSLSKPVKFTSDMFVKGAQAKDREDRIIYDKDTGALYYDADGTGAKAQVKIATLGKNLKLTYHDFFVI